MAKHPSALKAHRQNVKRRDRNRQLRSRLRAALKSIRVTIDSDEPGTAKGALQDATSLVDRMVTKRIIHRNTAARYKSRLTKRMTRKSA
ncbi:MAG: 30S ribosomal protein S20 [Acidobacteria bacterium]|nr:30S ribosomal protein S20 [Acidobacteriota bacterium]